MLKPYEQRFPWHLDWNLLRTFMVVVEQSSITLAADFLGLKQPTISSALKRLEETLDRKLIDRRPGHFHVTFAGRALYNECSTIFGIVSQLPVLLNNTEDEINGHITIALASHVISHHFDSILEKFNAMHPSVTYSFSVAESSEVINRVEQNRASLGICLSSKSQSKLDMHVLYREYFGLYCGPKHRLFNKKNITLSDLRDEDSVSFQTDVASGPLHSVTLLRELAQMKSSLKGVSANLPEVRRMIISNIGVGALPIHVAERDVKLGNLRQLPPYTNLTPVDIFMITNPKHSFNRAELILINMLEEFIKNTPLEDRSY